MAITSLTRNSIQNPNKYTDLLAGNSVYEVSSLVPIATITATGSSGSMAFGSITNRYQDLVLVLSGRSTNVSTYAGASVYFNNTGATGWSNTYLYGNGATASSTRSLTSSPTYGLQLNPAWGVAAASATAGVFSSVVINILNYANTSTYKTAFARNATDLNGSGITTLIVGNWANTSAIDAIEIQTQGNWVAGSTFTLYGVKAVGQ